MEIFDPLYQRYQAEQAIWTAFKETALGTTSATMPKIMSQRIQKLLELDSKRVSGIAEGFAFSSNQNIGLGHNRSFSVFDVFCLGIAMRMIDMGHAQSYVVFLFQHIRPVLKSCFLSLLDCPKIGRNIVAAEDYPHLPSVVHKGCRILDDKVFLVFQSIVLKEAHGIKLNLSKGSPTILGPDTLYGTEELALFFGGVGLHKKHASIIEIRHMALSVAHILPTLSERQRGRPAKKSGER